MCDEQSHCVSPLILNNNYNGNDNDFDNNIASIKVNFNVILLSSFSVLLNWLSQPTIFFFFSILSTIPLQRGVRGVCGRVSGQLCGVKLPDRLNQNRHIQNMHIERKSILSTVLVLHGVYNAYIFSSNAGPEHFLL